MAALFPEDEYAERLVRLRAVMAERGIDTVIADEAEMLHYVTGFTISENLYRCVVIPMAGTPTMVVRKLDEQPFVDTAWFDRRRAFADIEDSIAVTADVIKAEGAGCVGLDLNSYCMTAKRFMRLRELLGETRFVDLSDVMRALRINKSPREIEVLKQAAAIADGAMRRAIAATVPGASSRTGTGCQAGLSCVQTLTGLSPPKRNWPDVPKISCTLTDPAGAHQPTCSDVVDPLACSNSTSAVSSTSMSCTLRLMRAKTRTMGEPM